MHKAIILGSLCLLAGGCSDAERTASLPQRVCGKTLANPQRWIKSQEASARRFHTPGVGSADRRIAAEDCIRGNIYDLAASGLDEGRVVRAARAECAQLETAYLHDGYVSYVSEFAALKVSPPFQTSDQWEAQIKADLDELGATAFVEARAGQCWAHRVYTAVTYTPGT